MDKEAKVSGIVEALPIAVQVIEKNTGDQVVKKLALNNARHYLLMTNSGTSYYLLFKRNFFGSYGRQFNTQGMGESINPEYLRFCNARGIANILIVYEKGHVYVVNPLEWKQFAESHNTIRMQKGGERTYSIPLSLLKRWK